MICLWFQSYSVTSAVWNPTFSWLFRTAFSSRADNKTNFPAVTYKSADAEGSVTLWSLIPGVYTWPQTASIPSKENKAFYTCSEWNLTEDSVDKQNRPYLFHGISVYFATIYNTTVCNQSCNVLLHIICDKRTKCYAVSIEIARVFHVLWSINNLLTLLTGIYDRRWLFDSQCLLVGSEGDRWNPFEDQPLKWMQARMNFSTIV